jgi:signal peptidase I
MASNRTTDKVTNGQTETKTEARPSSFSRFFNRNGHDKKVAPPPAVQGPPKSVVREYFESAVVTVVMALFGMTFIVQAVKVPTGSMQNTITIGDHLLVNKFIFAPGESLPFLPQREIRRGDIIVFKYPGNRYDPDSDLRPDNTPILTNYVKRVIGLPGDRIRIEGRDVIVNDVVLPEHRIVVAKQLNDKAELEELSPPPPRAPNEPYDVYHKAEPEPEGRGERNAFEGKNELIVPPDSYFVLGDNRDDSQDSRFWGFVPRDFVIGRAMFVYWSYDESKPTTDYGLLVDFFKNTRWSRTGTLVK